MSKHIKLILAGCIILAILIICLFPKDKNRKVSLKEGGNNLVKKIELFKLYKGRLPNSQDELGISETESGPLYYLKKDTSNYIVWFGMGVGESVIYSSDSKCWNESY